MLIDDIQIQLAVLTQYFDSAVFNANPIKSQINNDIALSLNPQISQNPYFKLSQNNVVLSDSWLIDSQQTGFYQYQDYRLVHEQAAMLTPTNNMSLISLTFMLDENYVVYTRSVITIPTILSLVGGLMGFCFDFLRYYFGFVQE